MRLDAIRRMWERLRASGGRREVLDTDSFTDSERAVGRLVLPLIEDLEEARKLISELSVRTHALAVALDLLPVAAIVIDSKGRFVASNAQAHELFGGKGIDESVVEGCRRVARGEAEAVRVRLGGSGSARLVLAAIDADAETAEASVIFVAPEEQPASAIDPRLLMNRLQLTRMQARVVSQVSMGLSNREVAARLGLSVETVRKHLATAYARTGVNTRARIVALAYDVRFGGSSPLSVQ